MTAQRELTFGRQVFLAGAFTAMHAVVYGIGNHLPLSAPRLLPMTAIDAWTPFIPASVFLYLSDYALAFVAFMSLKRRESVVRFLWVFMTCVVIASAIHWGFPTTYPREDFPIPAGVDPLSGLALKVLRFFDSPNSCLPSLHVATATGSAVLVFREDRALSLKLFGWAMLVCAATLTAKQHYLVDVIGGWALLLVVFFAVDTVRERWPVRTGSP